MLGLTFAIQNIKARIQQLACLFVSYVCLFVETQPCSYQTGAFLFWPENQFGIYNMKLSSPYFRQKIPQTSAGNSM